MCETRTKLCRVLTEQVTESFQGQIRIFETRIPNTVKIGESLYYSKTVVEYSPKASAGIAYRKFAKELISYEANAPKRKIFNDALNLLGGADVAPALESGVQMLPIDSIRPFRKHPFRLYEGNRLDDMVESIREHGVLVPVIV